MEETCKDSLIKTNKTNLLLSFYSITEKQEESSSNSSRNDIKIDKQLNTDNSSNKNYLNIIEFRKKEMNNNLKDYKYNKKISSKTFNKLIKEKEFSNNSEEEKYKKFIKKGSKNTFNYINKRLSVQQNLDNNLKQIKKNKKLLKKQNTVNFISLSSKKVNGIKNNLSIPYFNNINNSNFNNNKLFDSKSLVKSKSINLSSSNSSFIHFINKKGDSIIKKRIIKFNDNNDKILQIDLFEKLKDSPMFEKSEKIIHKERIYYGILIFFTILSIIFQVSDSFLYNKKSKEFLEEKNNMTLSYLNELHYYSILKNRKISKQENYLRVFNIIFSFICGILSINIYIIKNKFIKQTNKNNKNFYANYNNYFGYNKKKKYIKEDAHINIIPNSDIIPNKKLPKCEIIKAIIICIMNIICCPPSFNKVYIINKKDIILVYSLNNFFLILSMVKFINIYRAIFHLSPLNKLIYKTICNSKMVKMDFKFMIRYFLNRYPITFIIFNFFIVGTIFCILIYSIEYFSLDVKNGLWNNKGNNNLKNIYNTIYLYLFYIIKNGFGDIKPKSELGLFIMIIGGSFGLFVTSYFFYYILQFINFSTEEKKAYQKLYRMLNPLNKEHKSANLIKFFILTKKLFKDYKNIEKYYEINKLKLKINKSYKKSYKKRIFNHVLDNRGIDNIFGLIEENYKYKIKFINYLCQKFIIKVKLISECNIFKNNLLIARNFSHSFTNLLKTLGYKMNENLNQLNNKLQIIVTKEGKYKDFIKFQKKNLKKIQKIIIYQNALLHYLINKHNNDNYEDYISLKRKIKRSIGDYSGTFLYSHKKLIKKHLSNFDYIRSPRKKRLNEIKSSILGLSELSKFGEIIHCKTYDNKYNNLYEIIKKRKIKKIKSLDNLFLNGMNIRKKNIAIELINIKKNKNRKSSYNFNRKEIIDQI